MRKSIFFKLALLIIPIILAYEGVQLYMSYRSFYDTNLESCKKRTESMAATAAELFAFFDPDDPEVPSQYSTMFSELCEQWGITYIYALEADVETGSEKYLAIGFGDDAAEIAKKTRYAGVVAEGTLSDAQRDVCSGKKESVTVHEVTELDDTLTSYRPIFEYFDAEKMENVTLEKPILVGAEMSFSSVMKRFEQRFSRTVAADLIFTFLMTAAIFLILYLRINGPVRKISKRMQNFVSDRDKGAEKLTVKGNDELAEMAHSFNLMTEEINTYIEDIDSLTKEKYTQQAELDIARSIQTGLLKPARYENESVSIHACMHAAKNVGGDLYDYYVLDDGRVFIAIADVSGKGISAALFMSRAITLLHQYAVLGYSPAMMLREYNHTLAEQNPNGLFITTFVAFYDPQSGVLTYSNAGHNHPYLLADRLIELDGAAGVAAGIFDGLEYEQETVTLRPGDVLFLYTDGVNEAENSAGEMFGTEALENRLREYIGGSDSMTDAVLKDIRQFAGDAVQSDDVTILTLRAGQASAHREITVKNQAAHLTEINEIINGLPLSDEVRSQLLLIAEELFVNICSYAYGEGDGDITVAFDIDSRRVSLTFTDEGAPFDPTADVIDIGEYDHENSVGGLGRFLVFELADSYSYQYTDGKNRLTVTKLF